MRSKRGKREKRMKNKNNYWMNEALYYCARKVCVYVYIWWELVRCTLIKCGLILHTDNIRSECRARVRRFLTQYLGINWRRRNNMEERMNPMRNATVRDTDRGRERQTTGIWMEMLWMKLCSVFNNNNNKTRGMRLIAFFISIDIYYSVHSYCCCCGRICISSFVHCGKNDERWQYENATAKEEM